jgi:hypothetical protein
MNEQQPSESKIPQTFAVFFEKALDVIEPPFMKLLVVFAVVVLLALLLVCSRINPGWGLVLVVVVVLLFACLAAVLQYAEMRLQYAERRILHAQKQLDYSKRVEDRLKGIVRDEVDKRLMRARAKQSPPLGVHITYLEYNPPGDDMDGEFVRIENSGGIDIDMTAWTLCDEAGHQFTFPAFTLRLGSYVRIWTKSGANMATDLYWGKDKAVWNNEMDCAQLRDSTGVLIATFRYGSPLTK